MFNTAQPIYALLWQDATKNFNLSKLTPEEFLQIKGSLKDCLKRLENTELRQAYLRQFDQLLHSIQSNKITPNQRKQIALPQQTNVTIEKILLVTLVNHPYLWEEVGELLMGINFKSSEIETHRQDLIEYFSNDFHNENIQKALPDKLMPLQQITDEGFYSRVPFAKIGYDRQMAKSGWLEVYNKLHHQQFLQNDQQQSAEHLKNDFNISNWQRLKATKKQ